MTPARIVACLLAVLAIASVSRAQEPDWISLFDGKTLDGWRVSENPSSFKVEDGKIVVQGPRAHAFYVGPVNNATFKKFEFKAKVLHKPSSNSGIYFHTEYQEKGWPSKGYECQVNSTSHSDPKKTGGLYAIKDVMKQSPVEDDVWFDYYIKVRGKDVTIKINGQVTCEYTEPDDAAQTRANSFKGRLLSSGTFALQGHDPKSVVYFKDIYVRPLAD